MPCKMKLHAKLHELHKMKFHVRLNFVFPSEAGISGHYFALIVWFA